jgi:hypothetical protein
MMVTRLTVFPEASVVQISTVKSTWCFRGFVNYRKATQAFRESRHNSRGVMFDVTQGESPLFTFTSMTILEEGERLACQTEGECGEC